VHSFCPCALGCSHLQYGTVSTGTLHSITIMPGTGTRKWLTECGLNANTQNPSFVIVEGSCSGSARSKCHTVDSSNTSVHIFGHALNTWYVKHQIIDNCFKSVAVSAVFSSCQLRCESWFDSASGNGNGIHYLQSVQHGLRKISLL
jgi:hypothetical protein